MAEVLAVGGGIASFVQILGYILQISDMITRFCEEIHNALARLERIKCKLDIL
jgi:hypothetical protein